MKKFLNFFAEALIRVLPIVSILICIWLIVLCFWKPDCQCLLTCPKLLLEMLGVCLSAWVVIYNLKRYVDVEAVKALHMLRKSLNSDEKKKIHFYLLGERDKMAVLPELESDEKCIDDARAVYLEDRDKIWHSSVELLDYLGTIELGAIMLRKGVIGKKEFDNQFGYRVKNIIANNKLRDYLIECKGYYEEFIKMVEAMYS